MISSRWKYVLTKYSLLFLLFVNRPESAHRLCKSELYCFLLYVYIIVDNVENANQIGY